MTASVVLYSCLIKKLPKFTDVLWKQELNYNSAFIGSTFSRYAVVNLKWSNVFRLLNDSTLESNQPQWHFDKLTFVALSMKIIGAKKNNKFPRCGSNKGLSYFIASYLKTNLNSFSLFLVYLSCYHMESTMKFQEFFYFDTSTMIKSKTWKHKYTNKHVTNTNSIRISKKKKTYMIHMLLNAFTYLQYTLNINSNIIEINIRLIS